MFKGTCVSIFEPKRQKTYLLQCIPNKDFNQPAHPRSLIKVFVVHMKKICFLGYPKGTQWWYWSDCAIFQIFDGRTCPMGYVFFLANIILAATELIIWSAPCKKCFLAYADIKFTFTVFKSNWYTFRRGVLMQHTDNVETTWIQHGFNALPLNQRWIDVVLTLCARWVCLPSENAPAIKGKNWPLPWRANSFFL